MKKVTKKLISLVLAVVLVLGAAPFVSLCGFNLREISDIFGLKALAANSGTCGDNLTWTLNTGTGELVISGSGAMDDWYYSSEVPWYSYCSDIKTVTIGKGVTIIGEEAFYECTNLTGVTIPDTVKSIGNWAFYGCTDLKDITIPDSVMNIGKEAFACCDSLRSVTIPSSVTIIRDSAFLCKNLTSITVSSNNQYYSSDSYGVLFNKNKTELIQYPVGNEKTSYSVPNSVNSINDFAFVLCTGLTSITVPDSVTSIGDWAFSYCDNLTSITVNSNNQYYSSDSYGVLFNKNKTELIQYPIGNKRTSYSVPNSVTSIADEAFAMCDSLTGVTIPVSVTGIAEGAFYGCDSISDIYYCGTREQYDSISIGDNNEPLESAKMHYNHKITNTSSSNITTTFSSDYSADDSTKDEDTDNGSENNKPSKETSGNKVELIIALVLIALAVTAVAVIVFKKKRK